VNIMASGRIQGLCLMTGGTTPAGLARTVKGSYEIDSGPVVDEGIGGQRVVAKGILTAKIEIEAIGLLKAELIKWFPTGDTLSALTPMLLVADTGDIFLLQNGVPGPASISVPGADNTNAFVSMKATAQFGHVTAGSGTPVYLATKGHLRKHATVQVNGTDGGVNSLEIANGLSLTPNADLDTRASGYEQSIDGYDPDDFQPTMAIALGASFGTTDLITGTAGAYTLHDVVLALANGTAGENLTFTMSDWIAPVYKGALAKAGKVYYGYDMIPGTGTILGRMTVA
jgi:hypothetical protein